MATERDNEREIEDLNAMLSMLEDDYRTLQGHFKKRGLAHAAALAERDAEVARLRDVALWVHASAPVPQFQTMPLEVARTVLAVGSGRSALSPAKEPV